MEEIILRVRVEAKDLDKLKNDLDDAGIKFKEVQDGVKETGKEFKGLKKSSGVMVFLNELTGGWANKLFDVGSGLKSAAAGLSLTSKALIATGIGLFVVALASIVAYFDEIVDFITDANGKLQEKLDLQNKIIERLEYEGRLLGKQEEIYKLQGASIKEIRLERERNLAGLMVENDILLEELETQLKTEESKAREFGFWEKIYDNARNLVGLSESKLISEDEAKILEDLNKQIEEAKERAADLRIEFLKLTKPEEEEDKKDDEKPEPREKQRKVDILDPEKEGEKRAKLFEKLFELRKANDERLKEYGESVNEEFLNSDLAFQAKRNKQERDSADVRERIAKAEAEAKLMLYEQVGSGLTQLGDILGRETAAGKGLAIAGALINTYASIAGQLKAFSGVPIPGFAIAQAVATGLAGFAAVKNIVSVKVPGGGGGGGVGGGVGGGGGRRATAPAFNVVDNNPQNQLNQSLLEQNQTPIKAFVTEGEVSTAQELSRSKVKDSSFG